MKYLLEGGMFWSWSFFLLLELLRCSTYGKIGPLTRPHPAVWGGGPNGTPPCGDLRNWAAPPGKQTAAGKRAPNK